MRSPLIDLLECRRHFSLSLTRHVLTIAGTAAANSVFVSVVGGGGLRLVEDGVIHRIPAAMVRAVTVDLGDGSDKFELSQANGRFRWPMTLLGGAGDDTLFGASGNDLLIGGAGADVLSGLTGDDVLRGNGGADSLDGGRGRDNLAGNAGVDTLIGGADEDAFHDTDAAEERTDEEAGDVVIADAPATQPAGIAWNAINDFTYQLQAVDLDAMGKSKFDLAIIDAADDNGVSRTPAQIAALKHSPGGEKGVLAYLSIGEAENYRAYWQQAWDVNNDGIPDAGAPSWLAKQNPEWAGNYQVRYWDPSWQAMILKVVDANVAQGFDGVYLDIVDAFETWGPDGNNQRPTAEQDMIDFVKKIAAEGRRASGNPDFAVVPQNGEALGSHADYLAAITAIGHEDVFYDGDTANDAATVAGLVTALDRFKTAGKPVFIIDYPKRGAGMERVYAAAKSHGYVAYCPRRGLDRLTINAGHEPD